MAVTKLVLLLLLLCAETLAKPATTLDRVLRALSPLMNFKRSLDGSSAASPLSGLSYGYNFYSSYYYSSPYSSFAYYSGSPYYYSSSYAGSPYYYSSSYADNYYSYSYMPTSVGSVHISDDSSSEFSHYSSPVHNPPNRFPDHISDSVAMFMTLVSKGCDDEAEEMTDAGVELMSSPIVRSIVTMLGEGEYPPPRRVDMAMAKCSIRNVGSLKDLAILSNNPLEELREIYPCFVSIGDLVVKALEAQISSLGPREPDASTSAVLRYWQALRAAGLLHLD